MKFYKNAQEGFVKKWAAMLSKKERSDSITCCRKHEDGSYVFEKSEDGSCDIKCVEAEKFW